MNKKLTIPILICISVILYIYLPKIQSIKQYDYNLVKLPCTDKYSTYDDYEHNMYHLNSIVNAECGICGQEEKKLVASVVYNRWKDKTNPILEVISRPNQFDGYSSVHYFPVDSHISLCKDVLSGRGISRLKYFYNPRTATDSVFVNWANTRELTVHKYHNYF